MPCVDVVGHPLRSRVLGHSDSATPLSQPFSDALRSAMASTSSLNRFLAALCLIMAATMAGSAQNVSIQGVWQATEINTAGGDAALNNNALPGLYIFTHRHYSMTRPVSTQARPPLTRADLATASVLELRATLLEFIGEAGDYDVSGSVLTVHRVSALIPTNVGTHATFAWHVEGDQLTLTQLANATGPAASPLTVKFMRIE